MVSSRRNFLRTAAAGTMACVIARKGVAAQNKPNIVFILADDLGWADIGYHGSKIRTPNLDRLAAEGVRFEHHYVAPTCTPTRVGLLTGRYPSRYGVLAPAYGGIFDKDTVTMAAALGAGGYETSISGKWHMGSPPDCIPRKYGFQNSYGYFDGQIDPYTHLYKTGRACWHRNDELFTEEGHVTDLITNEAIRVIESSGTKPFFLYVAYSVPHYPLKEPKEWTAPYEDVFDEPPRQWFAASVTHMDDGIGKIIDALDRTGQRENTLFVFASDNGGQQSWSSAEQYAGQYADKPHTVLGDNRPLRGWKGQVYEGGIRVPALANWPGTLTPGVAKGLVHIVDWMPTFCHLAGYAPPRDLKWDGRNVWPMVSGKVASIGERTLYWKTPSATALRQGGWKLAVQDGGARVELFNVAADPLEEHDLVKEEPERVAALTQLLAEHAAGDRGRIK